VVVRSARQFSPLNMPENALSLGFVPLDRDEIREVILRLARVMSRR